MRSVAVIAEFNPFHNGHAHLLSEIRRELGKDTAVTAIMSGWYVQRGDVAIASPYTRAEAALRAGFDLVLELPFPYSISSAEDFASAGVSLAHRLGCFDTLAFGCECENTEQLYQVADLRSSDAFRQEITRIRSEESGRKLGFAALARASLRKLSGDPTLDLPPNATLAVEYLSAIHRQGVELTPLPILRVGDGYHATAPSHHSVTSASAIRPLLNLRNRSE